MPVAVDHGRESGAKGDRPEELEVSGRVLLRAEDRCGDAPGGVVDRAQERELRPLWSQPGVAAPVELEEQALGRHPLAPAAVPRSPAPAGRGNPLRRQDPPDARAAERDPLPLREQLGEVGVVGSHIAAGGEGQQPSLQVVRDAALAGPAPVAVDEPGRPRRPEQPQQAPEMTLGTPQRRGRRRRGRVRPRRRGSGSRPDAAR